MEMGEKVGLVGSFMYSSLTMLYPNDLLKNTHTHTHTVNDLLTDRMINCTHTIIICFYVFVSVSLCVCLYVL